MANDGETSMLRHAVATVAYRTGKVLRGAPEGFGEFRASPNSRSAGEILAHMGDLFDWALVLAQGGREWRDSEPLAWDREVERFFASLSAFDAHLASGAALAAPTERLLQGPVADALTHAGQLALLRRLAGSPVRGENYFAAEIVVGRTGGEPPRPTSESG